MAAEDHSVAMFPSLCFYAYFEVLHKKRVMEMPNFEEKKSFYARLRWFLVCVKKS